MRWTGSLFSDSVLGMFAVYPQDGKSVFESPIRWDVADSKYYYTHRERQSQDAIGETQLTQLVSNSKNARLESSPMH